MIDYPKQPILQYWKEELKANWKSWQFLASVFLIFSYSYVYFIKQEWIGFWLIFFAIILILFIDLRSKPALANGEVKAKRGIVYHKDNNKIYHFLKKDYYSYIEYWRSKGKDDWESIHLALEEMKTEDNLIK